MSNVISIAPSNDAKPMATHDVISARLFRERARIYSVQAILGAVQTAIDIDEERAGCCGTEPVTSAWAALEGAKDLLGDIAEMLEMPLVTGPGGVEPDVRRRTR